MWRIKREVAQYNASEPEEAVKDPFGGSSEDTSRNAQALFHAKGYVLHGGTPVAKRTEIVEAFQGERYVPFIVLSVKAGGTGLNLTKSGRKQACVHRKDRG